MTAATSTTRPATSTSGALGAAEWLRVSLFAGLAASITAIAFDLLVAEHVVDRAVAIETRQLGRFALLLNQPFSREGQRGGLVAGELLLGAGIALILAGVATFFASRSRSPRRFWICASLACVWGVVVLPALVYPPLPPGVKSALPIHERQTLYVVTVAIGVSSVAAALHICASRRRNRLILAAVAVSAPALAAIALLPGPRAMSSVPAHLLMEFRIVSIASQLLFWTVLGVVGTRLARR